MDVSVFGNGKMGLKRGPAVEMKLNWQIIVIFRRRPQ